MVSCILCVNGMGGMAHWFAAVLFLLVTVVAPPGALAQAAIDDGAFEMTEAERADDAVLAAMAKPWTGDLDGMIGRGFVRIGVGHEPPFFVYDGAEPRGISVEFVREFEAHLRATLGAGAEALTVAPVPLPRDLMVDALVSGRVDLLAANLTVTASRTERVDFADPMLRDVRELVVTGPAAPAVTTLDDLARVPLHVRPSSSYFEHLAAINATRAAAGRPSLRIVEADEALEDYDLVELVSVGVIPAVVLDSHKAGLYGQIFENLVVREDIVIHEGGEVAWALRKNSPKLMDATNAFVAKARKGTELGNILYKRWIADPTRVLNATASGEEAKFMETVGLIRRYADRYGFEPVLIAAQGYQELRLDQSVRSPVGAIGIMQVMPATANDPNVGIPDIEQADRNVEAGVKYLGHLRDTYFDDPAISPFDQACLTFAAYNAGPGAIRKARARAQAMGLDPNVWFGDVEVAVGRTISREPVVYVRNILKYYTTYRIFQAREQTGRALDPG